MCFGFVIPYVVFVGIKTNNRDHMSRKILGLEEDEEYRRKLLK